MTDPRYDFKVSSSNLRMTLRGISRDLNYGCGQFVWKSSHGNYYLYNLKSHLILCTVSYVEKNHVTTVFIRYRVKGRYGGIIENWAINLALHKTRWCYAYKIVAVASKHLNDHVRSMRFIRHPDVYSRKAMRRALGVDKGPDKYSKSPIEAIGEQLSRPGVTTTVTYSRSNLQNFL